MMPQLRSVLFIFSLLLATSSWAQKGDLRISVDELRGEGASCQAAKSAKPELEDCDLSSGDIASLIEAGDLQSEYLMGRELAQDLRLRYLRQARSSLQSQYQAITWLTGQNPLDIQAPGKRLSEGITQSGEQCSSADEQSKAQFAAMSDEIKKLTPESAVQSLGLGKVPKDHLDKAKDEILKRTLIAWIEMHRIGKSLSDSVLTQDERKKLEVRRAKIRQAYPVIANFPYAMTLTQAVEFGYPTIASPTRGDSHPQIDAVLFPDPETGYAPIAKGQMKGGNEGLVNSVLSEPLPKNVRDELARAMNISLTASIKSVGELCALEPCQMMNLDLKTTADSLMTLSEQKKDFLKDAAFRSVCSCDLREKTEYVSGGTQLALAGAAIGGIVLCPFTFGVGCYVSAASGAALTVSAAANTVGAVQDTIDLAPLAKTVASLPGLSDQQRAEIILEAQEANKRMATGAVETVGGLVGIGPASRAGKGILSSKEAFRPIAKSSTSSSRLLVRTQQQRDYLQSMGVEFQPHNQMTLVEADVKQLQRGNHYINDNGKEHYGELLRITKLPKAEARASSSTLALRHPGMQAEIERLRKMGIDVVVDTSLKETNTGAYFWEKTRVIAISPDTSWQIFRHEVQHADFSRFIRPKLGEIREQVLYKGASASDFVQAGKMTGYTEKEIKRLDRLIRSGHMTRGIDESMATARELDEMGWKRYLPYYGTNPVSYGAKHRVDSLMEVQERGYELSPIQQVELAKGKAVLVMAKAYELGAPAAGAAGAALGGIEVGERIARDVLANQPTYIVIEKKGDLYEVTENPETYYNEKTGDLLSVTPEGDLLLLPPR